VARELIASRQMRDIPCVIVTGTDTTDLNSADVACVLRKPVTTDELIAAVENHLRKR
jgi:DNA-binding response OmpR family regulator